MSLYPTPHITAEPSDFASVVIMPGDPLRSEFMAKNFLTNAKLVNNTRGVQGYTGFWKDTRVSVMASGMGMPSMGIYSYELFNIFGVDTIIRTGSAGGYQDDVRVGDIVLAQGACTDSRFAKQYSLPGTFAPIGDFELLSTAAELARKAGLKYHVGNILSSDQFYNDNDKTVELWRKMGVLAVEMETAALYMTAARASKRALTVCTTVDHLITGESTTAQQREKGLVDMITLALDLASKTAERN